MCFNPFPCESCPSSHLCLCAIKRAWSSSHRLPALLVCPIIFFAYQHTCSPPQCLSLPPTQHRVYVSFSTVSVLQPFLRLLVVHYGDLWTSDVAVYPLCSYLFCTDCLLRPSPATDHVVTQLQPCTSSHQSLPIISHHNAIWQFVFRVQNLQPSQKVTSEIFEGHFLFFCNLKFLSSKQSILELCFICLAPEPETIKPPCELQS